MNEIENFSFDSINNNIVELNNYIRLIIKILFLIYNYFDLKDKNKLKKDINIDIKEKVDKIIPIIKKLSLSDSLIKQDYYNSNYLIDKNNLHQLIEILKNYRAYNYYLLLNDKMPEYKSYEIWNFIEALLKKCEEINLKFVLILDQYKNLTKQQTKLEELIKEYKSSKIFICSSIDDYQIRYALLKGEPNYILFQKYFLNLEAIEKIIDIKNYSDEKIKILNLFKNNMREIFECINEDDNNLNKYINQKIDKIKDDFNIFCRSDILRTFYAIYIYKNINYFWEYKDFYQIMNYISFKYFTYEKIDKNNPMFQSINKDIYIKKLELEDNSNVGEKIILKNKIKDNYYYKIDYSILIAENGLYKFIKDENNILTYEHILLQINKCSGKGDIFEEYIKSKIKKKEMTPIKDLTIDESIQIWSLFSHPSKTSNTYGLFNGQLTEKKIYFIDIKKQNEPMFDCAILDLKNNKIIFIQITTSKPISHDVFNRNKIIEYGGKALDFLEGYLIEKNQNLEIGFFFVFLQYSIDEKDEFYSDTEIKILQDMKKTNKILKNMIDKCKQENLAYCIYSFSGILSTGQPYSKQEYNIIFQNYDNLYISLIGKKNKIDNIQLDEESELNFTIKKRNHMDLELSAPLEEPDLTNNLNIKLGYEFYCQKFKLDNPNIFTIKMEYNFNNLELYCKSANCFGFDYYNRGNDYNIIYYDKELCVYNLQERKMKEFNEEFKKKTYRLYFLGIEFNIKIIISEVETKSEFMFKARAKNN